MDPTQLELIINQLLYFFLISQILEQTNKVKLSTTTSEVFT